MVESVISGKSLAFALVLVSCRSGNDQSRLNKIIDSDDRRPIGLELSSKIISSTGTLDDKCMITAIGQKLGITAGHCALDPFKDYEGQIISSGDCFLKKITWHSSEKLSTCESILAAELNSEADYAIVVISGSIDHVVLKQYNVLAPGREVTLMSGIGSNYLISEGVILKRDPFSPRRFAYDVDTEPGSSGAAVYDLKSGDLVGIHNGSAGEDDNWNYATEIGPEILAKINSSLDSNTKIDQLRSLN